MTLNYKMKEFQYSESPRSSPSPEFNFKQEFELIASEFLLRQPLMLFLHISSQFHVFVQCLYHQKDLLNGFQKYLTDIDKTSEIAIEYSKKWSYNEPIFGR